MSRPEKINIINCHIHTFTTDHTPKFFPRKIVYVFRVMPFLIRFLRWFASGTPYDRWTDALRRLENFHRTGSRNSQRDVFREVLHFYPKSTRFVVLPMDMTQIGHGPVTKDIYDQHDELAALAKDPDYGPQVIPFGTVYPGRRDAFDEFRRMVEDYGFRGLKLYTKLGFEPDHEKLMNDVYPFCVKRNIPVMAHCSRGGVAHKGWDAERRDRVTAPGAWLPVLRAFPDLRVCLAHFGGEADWIANLCDGFDPDDPSAREDNWCSHISTLIAGGEYPNLWTDISYTIFKFNDNIPLLRQFLRNDRIRERTLFGSDFYMTRQESLSEKAISIRLRDALGEADFRQIAETNPLVWLGETEAVKDSA